MKYFLTCLICSFTSVLFGQAAQSPTDWGNINKYSKANDKLKEANHKRNRFVFMGDSITEYWQDTSFFKNEDFVNRGISGQTTSQMLVRFRNDVIDLKPYAVVILAGINDIAENTGPISIENIFGNIVSMVDLARMNSIRVILCSVLPAYDFSWRPGLKPADKIIRLNTLLSEYALKNNIQYVDFHSAMKDERNGLEKKYSVDGVHPILAGYIKMQEILQPFLK